MENNENLDGVQTPDGNIDTRSNESLTPEEAAELKLNLKNVVEEIKELRKQNKELRESKETPAPAEAPVDETTKFEETYRKLRNQERESEAKTNKQVAFEKFISENKEFHPDNDITGLKRQALESKMSRFNTDGITNVGEFYSVIEEASILLKKNDSSSATYKEVKNPYSSTNFSPSAPATAKRSNLSPKEQILVDRGDATEEQILKMKEKRPAFLKQLLASVND